MGSEPCSGLTPASNSHGSASTQQGYLRCDGVVIARTGRQLYHISELPSGVDAGPDGIVAVDRPASEVFNDAAIASFDNAPITLRHPYEVDADNWRDLVVGFVRNPRRDGDHMVADLITTDRRTVGLVRNRGWRGVSCGYDAEYVRTGIGIARQTSNRGNHVAILPPDEAARCGDVCRITDSQPKQKAKDMHFDAKTQRELTDMRRRYS